MSGASDQPLVTGHKPGEMTPVQVVERARRSSRDPRKGFVEDVMSLVAALREENRERNREIQRRGVRNQKYYEGDHYGYFHPVAGWRSMPIKRTDPFYPHNKVRYYSDAVTAASLQSRFDLVAIPTRDDDRSRWAARHAKRIVDYYENLLLTEEFFLDEDKQRQFFGQVFFETIWDPNAGPEIERPTLERRVEQGPEIITCARCAASFDLDELAAAPAEPDGLPRCPGCGAVELMAEQSEPFEYDEITGYEKSRAGDCRTEIVPFLQMDWDRSALWFDEGLWCERARRIAVERLEKEFPWWDRQMAGTGDDEHDRTGTDLLEESTGNTGQGGRRLSRAGADGRVLVRQIYLRPEKYCRKTAAEPVKFAGGLALEANQPWLEVFPHGMYVLVVGNQPLDFDDRDFRDRFVHLKFSHVPNRAEGDGIEDIIRPQQEYNETRSLIVAHVKANAAPPQWIRDPISETDFRGQPGYIGKVRGLDPSVPLANLHHVAKLPPLDQHTLLVNQQADREMQSALKAWSTSTGAPDTADAGGAETARGMELITANANAQRGPELALRAHAYARLARQWLRLFRDNAVDERYVPFKSKTAAVEGRYFKGADLDGDYMVAVKRGSWLPKDEGRRRADLLGALQAGAANPNLPPKWRQEILDRYGVDVDLDEFLLDTAVARERIDRMVELAEQAARLGAMAAEQIAAAAVQQLAGEGLADTGRPATPEPPTAEGEAVKLLLVWVPLDPEVDEHPVHIAFLREWAKSSQSRDAHPLVQQAVRARISEHKEAMAMSAASDQVLAMQANAPQMAMAEAESMKRQAADRDHQLIADERRMAHARDLEAARAVNRARR